MRNKIALIMTLGLLFVLVGLPRSVSSFDGLVAYWNLDEGAGTEAADSTGNGLDGTLLNGPAWVDGKFGKALDFNGSAGALQIDNPTLLDDLETITISLWFDADSLGEGSLSKFISRNGSYELRFSNSSSRFYFDAERWNSSDGKWRFETGSSVLGGWHHLEVTYDYGDSNNVPYLYYDGLRVVDLDEYVSPAGSLADASGPLVIGNNSGQSRTFDGRLAEIRIFNRILNADEVLALATLPRMIPHPRHRPT
jgi:hypothetical protein